jgi:hypothetical protein
MDEFTREKINCLDQLIQQEALAAFQHQLAIDDAATATGDPAIDAQFKATAANARAALRMAEHRLQSRRAVREALLKQLNATPSE